MLHCFLVPDHKDYDYDYDDDDDDVAEKEEDPKQRLL